MNDQHAKENRSPDALDLDIVDALQVNPRARWNSVAELVERSEVTVARRYARMQKEGLAWSGIALHPLVCYGAYIEIRCWNSRRDTLIQKLSQQPDVITIGTLTGDFNIFCIVIGVSLAGVVRRLESDIPEFKLAEQMRFSFFHRISGGVDWRQGVVNMDRWPDYLDVFAAKERVRRRNGGSLILPPASRHRQLFLALSSDARAPLGKIATEVGLTPTLVKKTVDELMQNSQIIFRCDVARPYFDYPVSLALSLKVPPGEQELLAQAIGAWAGTRFCASVASTANLVVIAGLRDLVEGERFVTEIVKLGSSVEVSSRALITRTFKVYGRLLGVDGRATGHVPVDPWMGEING